MKHRYALFILFSILTTPVAATNFYVGANVGVLDQEGTFNVHDGTVYPPGTIVNTDYRLPDDSDLTYSVFAGYKLASDLFFEVGFADNKEIEGKVRAMSSVTGLPDRGAYEEYETDYLYAAFVGVWPIQNNWAFSARLGFSVWDINYSRYSADIPPAGLPASGELTDVDTSSLTNILVETYSDNASALLLGVGVSYALDRNIEFKFAVESHAVDFSFTNIDLEYDALAITLGGAYHF